MLRSTTQKNETWHITDSAATLYNFVIFAKVDLKLKLSPHTQEMATSDGHRH